MQPHIAFLPDMPYSRPAGLQARQSLTRSALGLWRRACVAVAVRRTETAALDALDAFDDRMLRDIGLTRCGITRAVRHGPGDRPTAFFTAPDTQLRTARPLPLFPGLRSALFQLATAARAAWQAQLSATPAAGLPDQMLRDIGVERWEVRAKPAAWHALHRPF